MLELAQAIKEIGLVAVLVAAIIALLWLLLKWLLSQITKDRENFNSATIRFSEIMAEFSRINAATTAVLSDIRTTICADQVEERNHHQLASVNFTKIREEHAGFKERLDEICKRIEDVEKAMIRD